MVHTKKYRTIIVIFIASIFLISGCVDTTSKNDLFQEQQVEPNQKTNITLTIEVGQDEYITFPTTFCQPNFDAFEERYPGISIEIIQIPEKQIKSTIQTKLVTGSASDIICYNKISAETELNVHKYFMDLSNEPWVKRLTNPNALTASDGRIYGYAVQNIPHALGIIYNVDMFNQYHLSVPNNYHEFIETCSSIEENEIIPIYAPFSDLWTFQIWTTSAWGYIGEKVKPGLWHQINSGSLKWSDVPEFKKTLERGYELFQKGYMQSTLFTDDYISAFDAFGNQECAMMIGTSDFITLMKIKHPDINLDIFPVPAFDFSNSCIAQAQLGGLLFIPQSAKHKDEAKLLIDFLSQTEQVERAQEIIPFVPMINDSKEPDLTKFQQGLVDRYISPGETCVEMNSYMKVPLDDLWKYYNEMFLGKKTPTEVLLAWDERFSYLMHEIGEDGF